MGNIAASTPIVNRCTKWPDKRILFIGLDAVGKTSILYRLKLGDVVTTIPTIGLNVETIEALFANRRVNVTACDVGLKSRLRPLMRQYFTGVSGLVCVVDSTDIERLTELDEEIISLVSDSELEGVPFVFLLNKQDIETEKRIGEETLLGLPNVQKMAGEHLIGVFETSATAGTGIEEAFQWLTSAMLDKTAPSDGTARPPKGPDGVVKPTAGLGWWVDAGKRLLCFGA